MGGLNVTDIRRGRIPLLWGRVRERTLAKGFSFNLGDAKCLCVCIRTKLSGRHVHSEKVRELGRGWVREEVTTDRAFSLPLATTLETLKLSLSPIRLQQPKLLPNEEDLQVPWYRRQGCDRQWPLVCGRRICRLHTVLGIWTYDVLTTLPPS